MSETTFTFRVDDRLKALFTEAAKAHDRPASLLLRDFMRDYVKRSQDEATEHDAWFRKEVQASLEDARPSVKDNEARRIFAKRREALLRGTKATE
ncbi:hypothetical protein [Cupriavidus basilensis]|uniref:Prevent host death protein, Phd antitoxin n=1 Tax=Cupriavidus basilensis TaxID=68895 RepID=A0A0C4Y9C2_9BURK|nr:hypothetical protein [Cupriavidus basilensis]AJG22057.1 Prevent host death protein, Phd antitoxin [Cupriavidus basilensis]